jgi:hypothetical protein
MEAGDFDPYKGKKKCRKEHDFTRYFGTGDVRLGFDDAYRCNRCGYPRDKVQSPEYMAALQEVKAITFRIIGCAPDDHQWKYAGRQDDNGRSLWQCKLCDAIEHEVELERDSPIAPRRWRGPTGAISQEAYSDDAVRLLLNDPEEYFRLRDAELKKVGLL